MDILQKAIKSLSKKEIINYKIYANRQYESDNRKDIALFDAINKNKKNNVDTDYFIPKIYPSGTEKNVYNRLKYRLLDEIDNSLVQFYFHKVDINYIHSELSLYHIYLAKSEKEVAHYHLLRAEKKALAVNHYLLLDVIYTELISLSIYWGKTPPQLYIEKRNKNLSNLNELRGIDDTLANVMYEIDRKQTTSKTKPETITVLNNVIKHLNTKKALKNNIVFKSKLFLLVSQLFISKNDFVALESFCVENYHEFLKKKFFSKNNHEIKLQMLRYICNALFINKKNQQALEYITLLHQAMLDFKQEYYAKNIFFYYNALANNYTVLDPDKAVKVLNEAKKTDAIINHPVHLGYVLMNLAGAYFDLRQFKLSLKNIIELYAHSLYENIDGSIKLQVQLLEIILRLETKQFDVAQKLIIAIKKNNAALLQSKEYSSEFDFLILLDKLITVNSFSKEKASKELIAQFLLTEYEQKNNSFVDYKGWLKEKLRMKN